MRLLCISDIHGHSDKLARVLHEGRAQGFDQLIVCGDLLFPGPDPLGTWKLLLEHNALCVQGLSDRAVAQVEPESLVAHNDAEQARIDRLMQFHTELGELIVARLGRLKDTARLPLDSGHELVVVHGSPLDPTCAMTFDMDDEELNALLGDDPGDIVVCGASHVPFQRQIGDVRIVNVGSVGESPTPGVANATVLETSAFSVSVSMFDVDV
ncbi:MAG TPA: metallophosphoesterase family protein [Polyangiaceae bacterium]|jgi:predicted phosphodiesterase|nr:metallophosphoesterase family protein [Polyangiaceae bacterium]